MNDKRERQRANRLERLQEAERIEARSKRVKLIVRWTVIIAVALGAALAYSLLSGGGDDQVATGSDTTEATPTDTLLPDAAECPAADGSSPRITQFEAPHNFCIDDDVVYAADFVTSSGNFTVALDPALDPTSVNNFIVLARYHAYDGTIFHRVIDNFMVQGGDLEGRFGVGGPGYRFTGAFPPEDDPYQLGSLAMANTGNPSTNGSQFFIVTGDIGVNLNNNANYSLLGQVTDGLDIPLAIQASPTEERSIEGRPVGDIPVEEVTIESVTIREATEDEISAYEDLVG